MHNYHDLAGTQSQSAHKLKSGWTKTSLDWLLSQFARLRPVHVCYSRFSIESAPHRCSKASFSQAVEQATRQHRVLRCAARETSSWDPRFIVCLLYYKLKRNYSTNMRQFASLQANQLELAKKGILVLLLLLLLLLPLLWPVGHFSCWRNQSAKCLAAKLYLFIYIAFVFPFFVFLAPRFCPSWS